MTDEAIAYMGWSISAQEQIDGFRREIRQLKAENAKLRELAQDIYSEYRYLRVRFHRTYVQHEERMRAIEQRMRELGIEVDG